MANIDQIKVTAQPSLPKLMWSEWLEEKTGQFFKIPEDTACSDIPATCIFLFRCKFSSIRLFHYLITLIIRKYLNYYFFKYPGCQILQPRSWSTVLCFKDTVDRREYSVSNRPIWMNVHSCQQKSIGLKFSKSQTGSDVRYSCHHNSRRFTFSIFAHSCLFSVLHSLQSITPRIY